MAAARTITIFHDEPDLSHNSLSLLISLVLHGGISAVLSFGFLYTPRIDKASPHHYEVRHLDLKSVEPERAAAAPKTSESIRKQAASAAAAGHGAKPAAAPAPTTPRQIAHGVKGPQTLVQPDLPSHIALMQEMPLPTVIIWTPPKTQVKVIVAPLPEKATAADVRSSLDRPNAELNPSDISSASIDLAVEVPLLPATTTSPLPVKAPDLAELPPVTATQNSAQPTPIAVMSISDMHMHEGVVTLAPVNETANAKADGPPVPASKDSANGTAGVANGESKSGSGDGAGPGKTDPAPASAPKTAAANNPPDPGSIAPAPAAVASSGDLNGNPAGFGHQLTASQITLPREGQFGAVVVGDSVVDQFPEAAELWSGRMAYTVYLHVGLARSWILQYSLPRDADAEAAGSVAQLLAPWPFNIVRPNLDPGSIDADALMIHGFVNQLGRFEALALVFPMNFPDAQFVLAALQQWQFRPASQNGRNSRVEVLLIIPEQLD